MTEQRTLPKEFTLLVFQVIWLLIMLIPACLWALLMTILPSRRKSLKDEVVLITGAGNGLGKELAMQMAKKGCKLALVDIKVEAVTKVANEINSRHGCVAKAYIADLGIPEDISTLAQIISADFQRVDILINNAALCFGGVTTHEHKDHEIEAMFRVNVMSHFWMIREFLPGMLSRNHGHVVAISSVLSLIGGHDASLYTSTKWAVTGMMHSLRDELERIPNNAVQISNVCPYFISSGTYVCKLWSNRLPDVSLEYAAKCAINGIEENKFEFTIPSYHYPFYLVLKIVPRSIVKYFRKIFYANATPLTEGERGIVIPLKSRVKLVDGCHHDDR
nr:PREDICTED: 17-beta-hydroxysteroid dehydrogenase 13-like [Bemisia tabaci]